MIHAGGLLLQTGIPEDYKILIAIVAVLGIVAGAAWKVYLVVADRIEKAREKEIAADDARREKELAIDRERREWTSGEAEKSRVHLTEITRDFKEALYQMEVRRDQNAEDQGQVLTKMAETLSRMAANMDNHDKTVNEKVVQRLERIEEQTRPRTTVSKGPKP